MYVCMYVCMYIYICFAEQPWGDYWDRQEPEPLRLTVGQSGATRIFPEMTKSHPTGLGQTCPNFRKSSQDGEITTELGQSHRVLQGRHRRGRSFTSFLRFSRPFFKQLNEPLKTCTPVRGTQWSTAWSNSILLILPSLHALSFVFRVQIMFVRCRILHENRWNVAEITIFAKSGSEIWKNQSPIICRRALDAFKSLRHVMRSILSVRPFGDLIDVSPWRNPLKTFANPQTRDQDINRANLYEKEMVWRYRDLSCSGASPRDNSQRTILVEKIKFPLQKQGAWPVEIASTILLI